MSIGDRSVPHGATENELRQSKVTVSTVGQDLLNSVKSSVQTADDKQK